MKFTRFKIYLLLPIVGTLIVFLGIALAWFSTKNEQSVLLMLGFTTIYLILLIILGMLIRGQLKRDFVKVGVGYSEVQKEMMSILAVPFAVMDLNADILWANYEMQDLLDSAKKGTRSMSVLFPNITKSKLPTVESDVVFHAEVGEFSYKVILSAMESKRFDESLEVINEVDGNEDNRLIGVYLYDETEISLLRQENYNQQMIIGLLYIDNYDEVLEVVDEVKRSLLSALVDRRINKSMDSMNAVIKKLEKDKYLVVFQKKYLEEVKTSGKILLEDV